MKKIISIIMILTILLPVRIKAENKVGDTVTLSNCVDGNQARFMLGLEEIKVKFIGIESEELIKDDLDDEINNSQVSEYVCSILMNAKKIRIEYEPNSEKEDRFGRIQAWIFVDDILLQEDLIKNGYARTMYLNDNYIYKDKLLEAQKIAKEKRIGIWKDEVVETSVNDDKEEKEEYVKKENKGFFGTLFDFIGNIFSSILKIIDDIISNIL